jgi:hypothetical protein
LEQAMQQRGHRGEDRRPAPPATASPSAS